MYIEKYVFRSGCQQTKSQGWLKPTGSLLPSLRFLLWGTHLILELSAATSQHRLIGWKLLRHWLICLCNCVTFTLLEPLGSDSPSRPVESVGSSGSNSSSVLSAGWPKSCIWHMFSEKSLQWNQGLHHAYVYYTLFILCKSIHPSIHPASHPSIHLSIYHDMAAWVGWLSASPFIIFSSLSEWDMKAFGTWSAHARPGSLLGKGLSLVCRPICWTTCQFGSICFCEPHCFLVSAWKSLATFILVQDRVENEHGISTTARLMGVPSGNLT